MMRLGKKPRWLEILWEPRDLWIGVYWCYTPTDYYCATGHVVRDLHVYLCLVPCLPIHLVIGSVK